uniref:Uncharacterized protein n=1 Tax=Oryza brachyantha TaxID=4533 RepID=J3LND2_ORYBR
MSRPGAVLHQQSRMLSWIEDHGSSTSIYIDRLIAYIENNALNILARYEKQYMYCSVDQQVQQLLTYIYRNSSLWSSSSLEYGLPYGRVSLLIISIIPLQ